MIRSWKKLYVRVTGIKEFEVDLFNVQHNRDFELFKHWDMQEFSRRKAIKDHLMCVTLQFNPNKFVAPIPGRTILRNEIKLI